MRLLAPAALALLVVFPAAELAHAQSRTGRATGSSSGSSGRIGSATGRASAESGRISGSSQRSGTARGSGDAARARSATEGRATGSTGIGSRNGSSTFRSQGTGSGDRDRTAVTRGNTDSGRGVADRTRVTRGYTDSGRGIADRAGTATGVTTQSGRSDRGVVYGPPPLRGSAVGTRYGSYGYDRGRTYDPRSYARRPRIYSAWPVTLIRTCPFSFGFGWGGGFACFQTHFTGGLFVPFVYSYPSTVINVYTRSSYVTPAVRSDYDVVYDDPRCAIVSVIMPGNDGYWKSLRLPANGAANRDQLQRLISNRLAEGYPFLITDVDGVRIEVPAREQVEKITIDPCR